MRCALRLCVCLLLLIPAPLPAQSVLHFKTRDIETDPAQRIAAIAGASADGRGHLILQFRSRPAAALIGALEWRGIKVLGDVPENGLLVAIDRPVSLRRLGAHYAGPLRAEDKISPLISDAGAYFLVAFHRDADMDQARAALLNLGLVPIANPDLHPRQLMLHLAPEQVPDALAALSALDDVAYIFPASSELARGIPVRPCTGALTVNGAVTQSIPVYGDGWDGPGLNAAALSYVFSQMTAQLDPTAAQGEILRAMQEWSKVVKVAWSPGASAAGARTVNIFFASGAHGDGYPFDGRGNVLAHTFYPAPPNPEPIAGDMHLDEAEAWRMGANTDLFSVALHELGHALGLGHADDPNAVMYPYYRMASALAETDKAAIRTLYAAQDGTPTDPPPPAALTLTVNTPPFSTTASTLNLTGSATGGSGTISVTWSANGTVGTAMGAPSAWSILNIPLKPGSNSITITAAAGAVQVSKTVTVTWLSSTDTTPPALTITSPSTATMSTSAFSVLLKGTASDNVGVTQVNWSNNFGAAGMASGTAVWSATVPLLIGNNTVTIRAGDAAGNVAWRTVVITRRYGFRQLLASRTAQLRTPELFGPGIGGRGRLYGFFAICGHPLLGAQPRFFHRGSASVLRFVPLIHPVSTGLRVHCRKTACAHQERSRNQDTWFEGFHTVSPFCLSNPVKSNFASAGDSGPGKIFERTIQATYFHVDKSRNMAYGPHQIFLFQSVLGDPY